MRAHKFGPLVFVVLVALFVTGCAALKPIIRTLDDLARMHCAQYQAKVRGVSVEDAWEAYCRTRETWAPWIDPVIRAQAEGTATVESQGEPAASASAAVVGDAGAPDATATDAGAE